MSPSVCPPRLLRCLLTNIDVSQTQVIVGRDSLVPDVYPMTSENRFIDTLVNNIINDSLQIEIPKQVMDVLTTGSISKWPFEPYYIFEWNYRTITL